MFQKLLNVGENIGKFPKFAKDSPTTQKGHLFVLYLYWAIFD